MTAVPLSPLLLSANLQSFETCATLDVADGRGGGVRSGVE